MPSPTTILFIGNSFTGRNDLPGLVRRLAAGSGRAVETRAELMSGMALKTHWGGGARQALAESAWDYVSLQEQSTGPFKQRARMEEYVRLFDEAIRERGARTVLYLTWARQDAPERQREITDAYQSLGRELGALVVPAGVAWERVLAERPEFVLHDADKSHPAPSGSYLAACCFHAALFGERPPDGASGLKGLNEDDAAYLRDAAWRTVSGG